MRVALNFFYDMTIWANSNTGAMCKTLVANCCLDWWHRGSDLQCLDRLNIYGLSFQNGVSQYNLRVLKMYVQNTFIFILLEKGTLILAHEADANKYYCGAIDCIMSLK